jgi:hypothetical protein
MPALLSEGFGVMPASAAKAAGVLSSGPPCPCPRRRPDFRTPDSSSLSQICLKLVTSAHARAHQRTAQRTAQQPPNVNIHARCLLPSTARPRARSPARPLLCPLSCVSVCLHLFLDALSDLLFDSCPSSHRPASVLQEVGTIEGASMKS